MSEAANISAGGTGEQGLAQIDAAIAQLRGAVPDALFKEVARALHIAGGIFKQRFRATIASKFKAGGTTVGNTFKSYVSGNTLDDLALHVFTRWDAARLFEFGGTIQPRTRNWLVIPVAPEAYGADGRVNPAWRRQQMTVFGKTVGGGGFRQDLFEGLKPIKVRGGWLLIDPKRPGARPGQAGKAMFLLVRSTARRPVLRFLEEAKQIQGIFGTVAVKLLRDRMSSTLSPAARAA